MQELEELLKTITEEMQKTLSARTVVGDPITIEGTTIIPLVSLGMGFGAGAGASKEQDKPVGGGGGGGLGIKPVAVIIMDANGVRVEVLKPHKQTIFAELAEMAPRIAESLSKKKIDKQVEPIDSSL
ncbi:MAG: sporulation protein YtfJ [Methanotrichaceae archaeon]|nr:sporulation protein YtfJ [Methanotrichaceae archaeon]